MVQRDPLWDRDRDHDAPVSVTDRAITAAGAGISAMTTAISVRCIAE